MAREEQSHAIPGARFVDPHVLSRIGNLELVARSVVDGFINGLHRAPYFGASVDFAEHRGYTAGDDIRRVDWRVYARTDRFYVKQYEADTNANFSTLLDVSKSMTFASSGHSKLEHACFLSACLSYMAHRQRDRVGIITFDNDVVAHVPPSAKHFDVTLHTLDRALRASSEPGKTPQPNRLGPPLQKVAEQFRRRSVVALMSDFYEEPDQIMEAIKPYAYLGNDLMVFHLLDPAELDFPYTEASRFEDIETGEEIPIVPESLAPEYKRLIEQHIATLRTKFSEIRVDYTLVNTSKPLDDALFSYLASRERMLRVR